MGCGRCQRGEPTGHDSIELNCMQALELDNGRQLSEVSDIRKRIVLNVRSATSPQPRHFRFGLRALFLLLAAVGVLCAVARSLVNSDPTIVLGIGAFCYGGIIAIPC